MAKYAPSGRKPRQPFSSILRTVGLPPRGMALHRATLDGFPASVVTQCAEITGIDSDELRLTLCLSTTLWKKRLATGRLTCPESDRLYRLLRIWEDADQLFEGDANATRQWLLSPALGLGNERPIDFVRTTAEFECVLDHIGRLDTGEGV